MQLREIVQAAVHCIAVQESRKLQGIAGKCGARKCRKVGSPQCRTMQGSSGKSAVQENAGNSAEKCRQSRVIGQGCRTMQDSAGKCRAIVQGDEGGCRADQGNASTSAGQRRVRQGRAGPCSAVQRSAQDMKGQRTGHNQAFFQLILYNLKTS